MYSNLKAVSISYKKTPLKVREMFSVNEIHSERLVNYFKEFSDISDVLVLSTCNRTEVYYTSDKGYGQEIVKLIGIEKGISNLSQYEKYVEEINDHAEAVKHLFHVAIGLEAQVVGDLQISNQIKRAYQLSADMQVAGPFLHRLMHTIFFTNKRVIQETPFRDGAASVSYATAEMIKDVAEGMVDPKILVLGIGEIGEDVCRNLAGAQIKNVFISNRTQSKAQVLAEECNLQVVPFEKAAASIKDADIIISSISNNQPFITKTLIEKLELLSHKFFFDLSVPRSIEKEVEDIPGAILYNIDDIKSKANAALEKRINAIDNVKLIIDEAIQEFNNWSSEMVVSPIINKLKNALEEIRQSEIARHLKNVDAEHAEVVEKVTKSMMQKIIKLPVLQLKAACKRGEAETLIDILNDLFDLEKSTVKK